MLVLRIANTFLYVEPIYIQASEAPQRSLKKVAVVMGNKVIYTDTYDQALAQLNVFMQGIGVPAGRPLSAGPGAAAPSRGATRASSPSASIAPLQRIGRQGRWAEPARKWTRSSRSFPGASGLPARAPA